MPTIGEAEQKRSTQCPRIGTHLINTQHMYTYTIADKNFTEKKFSGPTGMHRPKLNLPKLVLKYHNCIIENFQQ